MIDIVPPQLLQHLRLEEERARTARKYDETSNAIEFYRGELMGNEVDGRSKAVTRDVAEIIDQATVNILETMVSGEFPVTFETDDQAEPTQDNPQPVDHGEQATDAVHYWFMRKGNGYLVLHSAVKAGLMEREGVCKTFVERKRRVEQLQIPALVLNQEIELGLEYVEAIPSDEFVEGYEGDDAARIYIVTRHVEGDPVIRDMSVPYEEFFCSPDARDLDSSPYLKHERLVTLSDLREMGFEVGEHDLPGDASDTSLQQVRDRGAQVAQYGYGPSRQYRLAEEYTFFDANGDGIAERICVFRVGDKLLDLMEVEDQPFSGWSPFPMQHRWSGESLADKGMDIQAINTALLRNGLDSLYLSLAPRTAVDMSVTFETTIDDLLDTAPGTIVRYKGQPPSPLLTNDTSTSAFNAIQFMLDQRDARTGINRHSQGINADALNKTASGMAMLQDNSDKVLKYLARNFAEMLVAPMFAKRYRLMREFQKPFVRRIDGKPTLIDPSQWPEDIDVSINVGLGSNRREQRIQGRMAVLGVQKEAMAGGLRIVDERHIYNSIRGLVRDMAIGGSPNDFVADPAALGEAPERQDPKVIEAQGKVQIEEQRLMGEQQLAAARIEIERAKSDAQAAIAADKAGLEAQLQADRAAYEAEAARRRQEFDEQMAIARFEFDKQMAMERAAFDRGMKQAQASAASDDGSGLPKLRPGGDLDK